MNYKNKIVKLHRYLGLWLAVIMFVWFFSGIVMIYKTFPHYTIDEKYDVYQKLNKEDLLEYVDLIKDITKESAKIEFYKIINRPVCSTVNEMGVSQRFFLDNGAEIKDIDSLMAYKIASSAFNLAENQYTFELVTSLDTWIPWERMVKHFPIYKFSFEDEDNSQLYVSSKTGEILQHSTDSDRFWAYFGAIPHWFYVKDLRRHLETWRWVIVIISAIGTIMCFLGLITGVYRGWKKLRGKIKFSPYSVALYRWHHYLGFIFGFITLTWVFSGMMSLVPDKWFYDDSEEVVILEKLNNRNQITTELDFPFIFEMLNSAPTETKKIIINELNGEEQVEFKSSVAESYLLDAQHLYDRASQFAVDSGIDKLQYIYQEVIDTILVLREYDNYYYAKSKKIPLPVLKLEINNNLNTHLYIDPINCEILQKTNSYSRVRRWLYRGLHCLDFRFIYSSVYWEIVIILLMIGGTMLSITGCLLIFRRVKKNKK